MPAFMMLDVVISDRRSAAVDQDMVETGMAFVKHEKPASRFAKECEARLYGVTANGESVCLHVYGFYPSVVFPADAHFQCTGSVRSTLFTATRMDGWDPDRAESRFVRVYFRTCWACKQASKQKHALETSVNYVTQFYDVTGLRACGWVSVSGGGVAHERTTFSTLEMSCNIEALEHIDCVDIPPLRFASFDIECISQSGAFPRVEGGDGIVCVGVHTWTYGQSSSDGYVVFGCQKSAAFQIEGVDVQTRFYADEQAMLHALRDFWTVEYNAHIFISWNGVGFDYPFLWKRAEVVGAHCFKYLSADVFHECTCSDRHTANKQNGARNVFLIDTPGRIHIDGQHWFMKHRKCGSYSLSAVSKEFLSSDKIHLGNGQTDDYRALRNMILSGEEQSLADVYMYCLWDCILPSRLLKQEQLVESSVATARTMYTNWQSLLFGGETRKNTNIFAIKCHPSHVLVPVESQMSEGKYQGAYVLDPMRGIYDKPVFCLDFASLYPSIMRTFNLCPSTLVMRADIRNAVLALLGPLPPDCSFCFIRVDDKDCCTIVYSSSLWDSSALHASAPALNLRGRTFLVAFTDPPIVVIQSTHGVTPQLLTELVDERKRVRVRQAAETDPVKHAVLEELQKSIKIGANSVYGALGADFGDMRCKEIAALTTYLGRWMLEETKDVAEKYDSRVRVVYGDTDSIFVRFDGTFDDAVVWANKLSDHITRHFAAPFLRLEYCCYILIEFEKCYRRFILLSKKRYVGLIEKNGSNVVDAKGVAQKKRDYAAVLTDLYGILMTHMLDLQCTSDTILQHLRAGLQAVVDNTVPLEKYRKSKQLNQLAPQTAHWHVATELERRGCEAPRPGDRVNFIYVYKRGLLNAKAFEMAKDPNLAQQDGDVVNRSYYLTNELQGPICDLLQFLGEDCVKEVFKEAHDNLLKSSDWIKHANRQRGLPIKSGSSSSRQPVSLQNLLSRPKRQKGGR